MSATTLPPGPRPGTTEGRAAAPPGTPAEGRLASLDALRGFDMFWLLGGQQLVAALTAGAEPGSAGAALREQFTHVSWEGFRFYDFIFPLFLFLIGVAVPLSAAKRLARGDTRGRVVGHALTRVVLMTLLGLLVTGNLLSWDREKMRLGYSVLQMLGLGYLIAVVLVLYTSVRAQVVATLGILAGYWAVQMFVPVPGREPGTFVPGAIFSDWLYDETLGKIGKPWQTPYGRGWPVWMWTCGATAMLGVFAGYVLRPDSRPGRPAGCAETSARVKLAALAALGLACLAAGGLGSRHLPIVKNEWTSTYVLWCAGWSYLLLALFYLVVDVWGVRAWATLFVVIGANSILAYLIATVFSGPFNSLAWVLFGNLRPHVGDYGHGVLMALTTYGFAWLFLAYLYRRKVFFRL